MNIDPMAVYFFATVSSMGVLVPVVLWLINGKSMEGSKIEGLWMNESRTMKILIYLNEGGYQAVVVWTPSQDEKMLGSDIIRNLSLNNLRGGMGTYIDPVTGNHYRLKMKFVNDVSLQLQLTEKSGNNHEKSEVWTLVQAPQNS